jgi:uncharacterized lipoprotein YajG
MKAKILVIFCSVLMVAGCSNTNTSAEAAHNPQVKKNSLYDGISITKVKECMGQPKSTFAANNDTYMRYFTPSRCEVLFVVDNASQKVVDMKYLFPHAFTRYGYEVNEKQCPLAQKQCLLS